MGSSYKSGEREQMAELSKKLKEGERILEPTRRPDGTYRKPVRIRAGHTPEDEVVIYQSKGSLMKKVMASQGPPGYYEPDPAPKPKTKAAKKNERKKEKRLQAAAEKGNSSEDGSASSFVSSSNGSQSVNVLASQMEALHVSSNSAVSGEAPNPGEDVEKRIRALKKKIRLTEAQQQKTAPQDLKPEQLEKFSKLELWRQELKTLEDNEALIAATST